MKSVEGEKDLSGVEFGLFFGKTVLQGEKSKELAPWTILEDKVEFVLILEALFETNKEGVLQFNENGLFSHNIFFLVLLENVFLL